MQFVNLNCVKLGCENNLFVHNCQNDRVIDISDLLMKAWVGKECLNCLKINSERSVTKQVYFADDNVAWRTWNELRVMIYQFPQ